MCIEQDCPDERHCNTNDTRRRLHDPSSPVRLRLQLLVEHTDNVEVRVQEAQTVVRTLRRDQNSNSTARLAAARLNEDVF